MKYPVLTEEETINDDEINLLDYWRVLIKKKAEENPLLCRCYKRCRKNNT